MFDRLLGRSRHEIDLRKDTLPIVPVVFKSEGVDNAMHRLTNVRILNQSMSPLREVMLASTKRLRGLRGPDRDSTAVLTKSIDDLDDLIHNQDDYSPAILALGFMSTLSEEELVAIKKILPSVQASYRQVLPDNEILGHYADTAANQSWELQRAEEYRKYLRMGIIALDISFTAFCHGKETLDQSNYRLLSPAV